MKAETDPGQPFTATEADPAEDVYKMNRSLYGIPFSGRTFQRVIEEFMDSLGFNRCVSDKCVYIKWENGKRMEWYS